MPPEPIDTPAWVRDAVFYQIFPDRFAARAQRLAPARSVRSLGRAADRTTGSRAATCTASPSGCPSSSSSAITALYLTPIFASASNHRYHAYDYMAVDPLLGGDAALRELLDTAHGRGMRVILDGVFNHCGRGLLAVPPRRRERPAVAVRRLVPPRPGRPGRRARGSTRIPTAAARRSHDAAAGYRAWWGLPALPKLNVENPRMREYLMAVGRALAPLRHRRLAPRRPGGDRGSDVLAGVPAALPGDRPDGLPRRRDLGRGARVAARRPLRRAHELPARDGDHRLRLGAGGSTAAIIEQHGTYRRTLVPPRRARLRPPPRAPDDACTTRRSRPSSSTSSAATTRRGLLTLLARRPRARSGSRCSSSSILPGAPCIYYGDEIAHGRRQRPGLPAARSRPIRRPATARCGRSWRPPDAARSERALRRGTVRVLAARPGLVLLREADGARALVVVNAGRPPSRRVRAARTAWRRLRIARPARAGTRRVSTRAARPPGTAGRRRPGRAARRRGWRDDRMTVPGRAAVAHGAGPDRPHPRGVPTGPDADVRSASAPEPGSAGPRSGHRAQPASLTTGAARRSRPGRRRPAGTSARCTRGASGSSRTARSCWRSSRRMSRDPGRREARSPSRS